VAAPPLPEPGVPVPPRPKCAPQGEIGNSAWQGTWREMGSSAAAPGSSPGAYPGKSAASPPRRTFCTFPAASEGMRRCSGRYGRRGPPCRRRQWGPAEQDRDRRAAPAWSPLYPLAVCLPGSRSGSGGLRFCGVLIRRRPPRAGPNEKGRFPSLSEENRPGLQRVRPVGLTDRSQTRTGSGAAIECSACLELRLPRQSRRCLASAWPSSANRRHCTDCWSASCSSGCCRLP
jgi:hypothetical protein